MIYRDLGKKGYSPAPALAPPRGLLRAVLLKALLPALPDLLFGELVELRQFTRHPGACPLWRGPLCGPRDHAPTVKVGATPVQGRPLGFPGVQGYTVTPKDPKALAWGLLGVLLAPIRKPALLRLDALLDPIRPRLSELRKLAHRLST